MSRKSQQVPPWAPAHRHLYDTYSDFILSRKGMLCRERTVQWYEETLLWVLDWMVKNEVHEPQDITARHVRAYLASMKERHLSDYYIHNHARTIKTYLKFLHAENYITTLPVFKMPTIAKKKLLYLKEPELQQLLRACNTRRDKALILTMVDTGARRSEVCQLNWGDIDVTNGLIQIVEGKGGKARSVVVGVETRRALLAYRRELGDPEPSHPMFQTGDGNRFMAMGFRSIFDRLSKRSGVKVTPHALRRTFATMSLRAGMNPLYLQALMGHTTLQMTNGYITMLDEDLVNAHHAFGPIDNVLRKARK